MNKNNIAATREIAFLFSMTNGLTRLLAIITTFFFWFCIASLALCFFRSRLLPLNNNLFVQVLLSVGISPVALTVFSWRIIEKYFSHNLLKYADRHTVEWPDLADRRDE